jgi:hypothetical protein
MVWINNKHYNAKSYPKEARGGAMCNCKKCRKYTEEPLVCPVCGCKVLSGATSCCSCGWYKK